MRQFLLSGAMVFALAVGSVLPAHANGEFVGTFAGAGLGGYVGNQFGHGGGRVAATTAGVLAGGFIGNRIGRSYDQPSTFYQPYYLTPGPVYYAAAYVPNYVAPPAPPPPPPIYVDDDYGSYCREYSKTIRIGDDVRESYGTACLQSDGSWRAVRP
jgi:surface antigen